MKQLKCPNCGASINRSTYICEYCGSHFKNESDNIVRIETYQNPCKVYKSSMYMNSDAINCLGPDEVSKIAINELSRNLSEAIAPNMDMETEYDPIMMRTRISARVRIVEPKYMF